MHIVHKRLLRYIEPYDQWLFLVQNTRYQNWILCKTNSLCEFILSSTSAKRVMYFLGYVDAALECNIQTCKYSDFLSVTAKYLRRMYSCYNDCL